MDDIIIIAVLVLIVGAALAYVIKAKKRGVKCIGCPAGSNCESKNSASTCSGGCSCCSSADCGSSTQETDSEECCCCNNK